MHSPLRHLFAILTLPFLFAVCETNAANINVDGTTCSLADAITSANNDSATGGCSAGSGADTLTLQADVTLSGLLPQLTSAISIEGGGKFISGGITSGNSGNVGPVLDILGAGAVIAINNTIVKNGYSNGSFAGIKKVGGSLTVTNSTVTGNTGGVGGGIYNNGSLTLTNSIVSNNTATDRAGGIYHNSGSLTLTSSTVSGNSSGTGGGILCATGSTCTLTDSIVSGNSGSSNGGGVLTEGTSTLTLTRSTISGNTSPGMGGGIYNGSTATVTNSTISGNSAQFGGGLMATNTSSTNIQNSTIGGNSSSFRTGGIYVFTGGQFTIGHSILAGNTALNGWPTPDGSGDADITSVGYNIIGAISGNILGSPTGDIRDTSALNLGSLADNGGPTRTMAIGTTSVAYNAGNSTCTASTDQRGIARPQGANCDIGAFEFSPPTFVGSTTTLTVAQSASATDIKGLLHASDADSGQTLTWTESSAPTNGTLSFSSATASGGSTDITPGGTITYAPATGYVGSDSFTVQVSDGTASSTRTINVTVGSALTVTVSPTTLSGMTIGTPVSQTFTASGGYGAYTYSIRSGSLPTGLTLSTGGLLSGTPTFSGTYNFTVQATDSSNGNGAPFIGSQIFSVTLAPLTSSQSIIQTQQTGVTATLGVVGCSGINSPTFITPPTGAPASFPYGLLGFTLTGCEVGRTATVTVTYSQNLPAGLSFYKYLNGSYSTFGATVGSNYVTFQLTDGGAGDSDNAQNGNITDPGGLGIPASSIPTLSEWGILILAALLALIGGQKVWRRNLLT